MRGRNSREVARQKDREERESLARQVFARYEKLRDYGELLAEELGQDVKPATIWQWRCRGYIPRWAVPAVRAILDTRVVDAG